MDWTPNTDEEDDEESSNSSKEEGKTPPPDQWLEEEEGPTTSQETKQCGRSKVKSKTKRSKTHTADQFDKSGDQMTIDDHRRIWPSRYSILWECRWSQWRKSEFTPYMYFKQFVTDEVIQLVADQPNIFSVQKEGRSININVKEIEQILGMYMFMGLLQMPCVRAYW